MLDYNNKVIDIILYIYIYKELKDFLMRKKKLNNYSDAEKNEECMQKNKLNSIEDSITHR